MYALEPEGAFLTVRAESAPLESIAALEKAHQVCATLRPLPDDGRYWLPPGQIGEVLKAIAVGAQFTWRGKPVIPNLYTPVPLVEGKLRIRDRLVAPDECDAIGRRWCLYKGALRLLDEEVPQHEPPPPTQEVWPILQLTDPRGAFAKFVQGRSEWEADLLDTDFIKKQVGESEYFCPMDKVAKALTFLLEVGWTIRDAKGRTVHRQTALETEITDHGRRLQVAGRARYDQHETDLSQVIGTFNRRERFVAIDAQNVGLLPPKPPLGALSDAAFEEGVYRLPKSRIGQLTELMAEVGTVTDPTLRAPIEVQLADRFVGTLRPYQQVGLNWLVYLHNQGLNGLLADDMGLGKTVQVIAFLASLDPTATHLIVVPTSLLFNWRNELERFLPDQEVMLYHGSRRDPSALSGVVLTSYGTLRADQAVLAAHTFCSVILDEAQTIKNPDSLAARAARAIPAAFRLCISGTPVENRSEELWSLFHFLMPDLLGDRQGFAAKVAAAASDSRHGRAISQAIRPFILRRTKEEVAPDLPPKIEQLVPLAMQPEQRAVYEGLLATSRQVAETGSRMEVLERILRLRQVCCHPILIGEESAPSVKLRTLLFDLDTLVAEGRKVLVYSQFATMLQLIGRELAHPHLLLTGKTQGREGLVERFQTDPTISIFLISLKAGGTGLNLTAADTVLLYDPWWNEAAENQAIDRAHRIGQDKKVVAKRYILTDTIEEKLMRLKEHKRSLGDSLLDETALSDTALRSLLVEE